MFERSYLSKTFLINDPDARLRRADNLMAFETSGGAIRKIPKGTRVRIDELRRLQAGANKVSLFAHAVSIDGAALGWTSTGNLGGKFINETLDLLQPAAGSGQFGPNAAWSRGSYLGQISLVEIVDAKTEIERLATSTIEPYLKMVGMASAAKLTVAINSGFRSWPEQKALYDGYIRKLPGFNLAAKPGTSNHQSGVAFDIDVAGADGNEVYDWLKQHAPALGFVRTVNGEPWHWEYDPRRAQKAVQMGTFKIPSVTN